MNNSRRKQLEIIKNKLQTEINNIKAISSELSIVLDEEQDAFDNMPEGLQSSYRGMCSEDTIDSMEEASEELDEVIKLLSDIV